MSVFLPVPGRHNYISSFDRQVDHEIIKTNFSLNSPSLNSSGSYSPAVFVSYAFSVIFFVGGTVYITGPLPMVVFTLGCFYVVVVSGNQFAVEWPSAGHLNRSSHIFTVSCSCDPSAANWHWDRRLNRLPSRVTSTDFSLSSRQKKVISVQGSPIYNRNFWVNSRSGSLSSMGDLLVANYSYRCHRPSSERHKLSSQQGGSCEWVPKLFKRIHFFNNNVKLMYLDVAYVYFIYHTTYVTYDLW